MTVRFSDAAAHANLDARTAQIDTGAGTANVTIRTGAVPTNLTDAENGSLLVTINLQNPSFPGAAARSMALNGVPLSGTAGAAGTAAHYRVFDRNGAIVEDGSIGADMTIDNAVIANGQTVNITAWTKSYT
jgi:hypothetical protein